jgi:hypothetical protein
VIGNDPFVGVDFGGYSQYAKDPDLGDRRTASRYGTAGLTVWGAKIGVSCSCLSSACREDGVLELVDPVVEVGQDREEALHKSVADLGRAALRAGRPPRLVADSAGGSLRTRGSLRVDGDELDAPSNAGYR